MSPSRLWWSSLPLRVVVSTLASSALVLVLGGLLLLRLATDGIVEAKRETAIQQASAAFNQLQTQLRAANVDSVTVQYERLTQLLDQVATHGGQYIVMEGTLSGLRTSGIAQSSVPDSLRQAVQAGEGMWVTPTTVRYSGPNSQTEPGLAIGATLEVPLTGELIPTYFIFPLTTEVATLRALEQAVILTGILLIGALGGISFVVARQVVRPVRLASQVARRLASGELNERLRVRGTDDLASLATSMNNMASELQQQIGRLENLSRLQQRFVSDVSHELRTPLTTVKMASEMLYDARDRFDAATQRSAELLHHELERFDELLSDLLEISRFDAGAATLALEDTDLVDLVRAELDAQRAVADRLGIELRLHQEGPIMAEVEPRRIRRIVRNLVSNALEHGERLPVDIRLAEDQDAVAIAVRDRGVGFLPNQASLVFDRFWRADPSRTRTVGGSGLGLAIAREDARLHGGWLAAWGRPNQGAQFRLTLPKHPDIVLRDSPLPLIPLDLEQPLLED
ncbi:MAG: MtrAB system histidine kinase MtrB [Propionibacteriaceae bacterium]|nr:MtrAB system histidine kinase MtrB [Propionibacteriaceae bacterium]